MDETWTDDEIESALMELVESGELAFGVDEQGHVCWWPL